MLGLDDGTLERRIRGEWPVLILPVCAEPDERRWFVDGLEQTLDPKTGKPYEWIEVPVRRKKQRAVQPDGMHPTEMGARWQLAEPILQRLAPCYAPRAER